MANKILIVGAGVCGPALATFLLRSNANYSITVVERFPSLRTAGQQIDVRHQGLEVMERMGLLAALRKMCVNETGMEVVDSTGKPFASFGINPGKQTRPGAGLTNEYEIMRGGFVELVYKASLDQGGDIRYRFGETISDLAQDPDGVDVTFKSGAKERYDLVVGADGLASRTRAMVFGEAVDQASFHSIGVYAAYYSIPRIQGEDTVARAHWTTGRRFVVTRTSGRPVTQVLFFTMDHSEMLGRALKSPLEDQKDAFATAMRGVGWQDERLISGLKTSDDFYSDEVGQIKLSKLYRGRVVLLGDAGHCTSPFTGMGTTASLIGAYVLAGELVRHGPGGISTALQAYDEKMKEPIAECQRLPKLVIGWLFPSSRFGVWVVQLILWVMSKLSSFVGDSNSEDKNRWKLPQYPELHP